MSRDITPEQLIVIRAANDEHNRPLRSTGAMVPCPVAPPAEMAIISIEEWTNHFSLRWWFATPQPQDEIDHRLQDGLHWRALDNSGTSYLGGDFGGGGGNSPRWVTDTWFAPALPPDWTHLTLWFQDPADNTETSVIVTHRDTADGH